LFNPDGARVRAAGAAVGAALALSLASGLGPAPAAAASGPMRAAAGAATTIEALGQPAAAPAEIDGRRVVATLTMTATAYGPSAQNNYPYGPVNYFGQPLAFGMVAVDPSVIPLGTTLYIQGYHDANLPGGGFVARALDEGDAIQGNRIDIFMPDGPGVVSNFGIQRVTVDVLAPAAHG
jgi:3D (Asp-Asp-Asp) domain-containing protein